MVNFEAAGDGHWPTTVAEGIALQRALAPTVDRTTPADLVVHTAAGLDVAYRPNSDKLAAAAVVLDVQTLAPRISAVAFGTASFPYVTGLFAFRELPALLTALRRLPVLPDLLICDAQGIAHPRRFGLACHVGLLTGVPTIGVAKTPMGDFAEPARMRGSYTALRDGEEIVGRALRTQTGAKPVFVSIGHRIDLDRACAEVLRVSPTYRLPETTRLADQLSRQALQAS